MTTPSCACSAATRRTVRLYGWLGGEELTDLVRILRILVAVAVRREEEHASANDQAPSAVAAGGGVAAVELGELQEGLGVRAGAQEDAIARRPSTVG
jgi:hypothetical protein